MCRSGSAGDTQAVAGYVQHWVEAHQQEKGGPVDVSVAATLCMQLLYNNKNGLQAGLIVAGWDHKEGGRCVLRVEQRSKHKRGTQQGAGSVGRPCFLGMQRHERAADVAVTGSLARFDASTPLLCP
jgi:hypothetical protein